jgi:hypothetical protein
MPALIRNDTALHRVLFSASASQSALSFALPCVAYAQHHWTVVHGALLSDSTSTCPELGLTYRPIQEAFQEAVALIKAGSNPSSTDSTL